MTSTLAKSCAREKIFHSLLVQIERAGRALISAAPLALSDEYFSAGRSAVVAAVADAWRVLSSRDLQCSDRGQERSVMRRCTDQCQVLVFAVVPVERSVELADD